MQGLVVLALKTALNGDIAVLSGDRGSFASALDYALAKPPVWLQEIFACEKLGRSFLQRLFIRVNPERKRAGPVEVAFNSNQLNSQSIEIFLDSVKQDRDGTQLLLAKLDKEAEAQGYPADFFKEMFLIELKEMIAGEFNFNAAVLKNRLQLIQSNPSFRRLIKKPADFLNCFDTMTESVSKGVDSFGYIEQHLLQDTPLIVAATAIQVPMLAIWQQISNTYPLPIKLYKLFPYALELVNGIIEDRFEIQPDIVSAGIGPAIKLMQSKPGLYKPFMFAPDLGHRVVASRGMNARAMRRHEMSFVINEPTTGSFCYDALKNDGYIDESRLKLNHLEPDEVFTELQDEKAKFLSLQWFPHYNILLKLKLAELYGPNGYNNYNQPIVLLAHKRLIKSSKKLLAVRLAINNAWLGLREEKNSMNNIIDNILGDRDYLTAIRRFSGLRQ